ncbi:type II secretion system F family protein [Castellaniella sp.]|uniref:type II secretion system F family protein n=1 Tax=Castellaniella sp. TaxID=1955812 RepID=UPI00355EA610
MFWSGLVMAALALGLGLWLLGRPWARSGPAARGTALPLWWPWVLALEPWCRSLVTWKMRLYLRRWAPRAGLDDRWNPARWLAARLLCMLAAGALATLSLFSLGSMSGAWAVAGGLAAASAGYFWPEWRMRRQAAQRRLAMQRDLPFMLDLLNLCVEAGQGLSVALRQVAGQAPEGLLRDSLFAAVSLERTGVHRAEWLQRWADDTDVPGVRNLVFALHQADRLGMSLGPLLRAQAERQRSERFQRAEKLALEAPVKMLFPMALCIFPCTFVVIAFPVIVKFLGLGA